jgi:hypothetical protein
MLNTANCFTEFPASKEQTRQYHQGKAGRLSTQNATLRMAIFIGSYFNEIDEWKIEGM